MKPNILLISTVVSRNLHRAIKDVSDYTNVKLIFAHDLPKNLHFKSMLIGQI